MKHFPSIDHAILLNILRRQIPETDVLALAGKIIASGAGILDDECPIRWFPGDDLLSVIRPRGLPIGNLTSQFWSNCYLNHFDHFVKRELRCSAYLRYVDDFALFSNSKRELARWRQAVIERLASIRLTVHPEGQTLPVIHGIPWLGFIVFPTHRRVKGRNVRNFTRRLRVRWRHYCLGEISFAVFNATVQGWINHVCHADTWGLREHVLGNPLVRNPPLDQAVR